MLAGNSVMFDSYQIRCLVFTHEYFSTTNNFIMDYFWTQIRGIGKAGFLCCSEATVHL